MQSNLQERQNWHSPENNTVNYKKNSTELLLVPVGNMFHLVIHFNLKSFDHMARDLTIDFE